MNRTRFATMLFTFALVTAFAAAASAMPSVGTLEISAGYYSVSLKDEDTTASTNLTASDGKFGFNLGAGVGFPVGPKTKLNLMGNYHTVSTAGNSTNYMNIRAGLGLSL